MANYEPLRTAIMKHEESHQCSELSMLDGCVSLAAYWNDEKTAINVLECTICNGTILDFRDVERPFRWNCDCESCSRGTEEAQQTQETGNERGVKDAR